MMSAAALSAITTFATVCRVPYSDIVLCRGPLRDLHLLYPSYRKARVSQMDVQHGVGWQGKIVCNRL